MVWIETKNHQKSKHMAPGSSPPTVFQKSCPLTTLGMVERSIGHSKELKVMEVGVLRSLV